MFEQFLENEKKYSKIFLNRMQAFSLEFEVDEYSFLKNLDNSLLKSILDTIELVLKNMSLKPEIKFLALGDFLFSMVSLSLKDPSELIYKTERTYYMDNIRLRAVINQEFDCDWSKYILLHKRLLIGLRTRNIIDKTIIKTKNKNGEWDTKIYLELNGTDIITSQLIPIGYSKNPFIVCNLGGSKFSVASFRNIWKVKRKKKEMENYIMDYDSIKKANRIPFKISSQLIKITRLFIDKEKEFILEKCGCSNTTEYLQKLREIIENKKYAAKLIKRKQKIEDADHDRITISFIQINKTYEEIIKNFSKLLSFLILEKINTDTPLYLPSFIDNRGRQYYGTLLSPTFYKLFRNLYRFENSKEFADLEKSIFYKKIMKYEYIVKEFNIPSKNTYVLIILLIEVGKFFIKDSGKYLIKTEEIISQGIKNYYENNLEICFDDKIYLKKIYCLIEKVTKMRDYEYSEIIFKDATASGLQNYGILLGYKNEMLKYLNLDGDEWCDTYMYIIKKFIDNKYKKYWKRRYWKSTIMTIPYNATWYTCFLKFLNELKKDNIDYKNMSTEEKNEIRTLHKNFYNKIKTNIKKEFYLNETSNNLIIFKYNKWITVSKKDYKVTFEKNRDKYTDTVFMLIEDQKATERAQEANNMHRLDSMLVKRLLEKYEILPIHDCFGIKLSEIHLIMDEINNYYSEVINKNTYSIHVII